MNDGVRVINTTEVIKTIEVKSKNGETPKLEVIMSGENHDVIQCVQNAGKDAGHRKTMIWGLKDEGSELDDNVLNDMLEFCREGDPRIFIGTRGCSWDGDSINYEFNGIHVILGQDGDTYVHFESPEDGVQFMVGLGVIPSLPILTRMFQE